MDSRCCVRYVQPSKGEHNGRVRAAEAHLLWAKIRERRLEIEMSQEALAEKAGLHRNSIGEIECGENNIPFLVLLKLARALTFSPGQLMDWVTEGIIHF